MRTPNLITGITGRAAKLLLVGVGAAWAVAWVDAVAAPTRPSVEFRSTTEASLHVPFARVRTAVARTDPFTGSSRVGESAIGIDAYGWPFASLSAHYRRVEASEHPTFDVVAGVRLPGYRRSGVAFVRRALPVVPEIGFVLSAAFYTGVAAFTARVLSRTRAQARVERCTLCLHELTGDGVCEQCGWVRDQLLADTMEPHAAKHAG